LSRRTWIADIRQSDCNLYFRRNSQIFGEDPASGAAYVVGAANLAAGSRGSENVLT